MLEERRKAKRFEGRIGVVSSDTDGLNFSFVTDLSREGAWVETEKLLAIGAKYTFVLSNGITSAPLEARVIRVKDAFFHGGKSGMGLKFENMQGMVKAIRDDLLLCFMNQKYQDLWDAA